MDVYLPADFYRLRDDLCDWRDVPTDGQEKSRTCETPAARDTESCTACADPLWRVF